MDQKVMCRNKCTAAEGRSAAGMASMQVSLMLACNKEISSTSRCASSFCFHVEVYVPRGIPATIRVWTIGTLWLALWCASCACWCVCGSCACAHGFACACVPVGVCVDHVRVRVGLHLHVCLSGMCALFAGMLFAVRQQRHQRTQKPFIMHHCW